MARSAGSAEPPPREHASRLPLAIGSIGTLAWLVGMFAYSEPRIGDIAKLDPNEFGDFLAGVFAPLAFLWIVVGYLQQSAELRLQVAELTEQVRATQELAATTASRTDREARRIQPVFEIGIGTGQGWVLHIHNRSSHRATALDVEESGDFAFHGFPIPLLLGQGNVQVEVTRPGPHSWVKFTYLDAHDDPHFVWAYFGDKPGPAALLRIDQQRNVA